MMRQEYIAGLEEIRKRMIEIGQAFAAVYLTDATGMESDRRKKTAKLVGDLADRLYEDIAISAKVAADKAEAGQAEQDDLFAAANREKKAKGAAEAAVVDVPPLALPEPKCVHYKEPDGCDLPEADCTGCAACDGTRRECAKFALANPTGDEQKKPGKGGKGKGKKPGKKGSK